MKIEEVGGAWQCIQLIRKGVWTSAILTVEETRRCRTDVVRNVVECISQAPPSANYIRKCYARKRKGQTPTAINLTPYSFNHDTNSSFTLSEWNQSRLLTAPLWGWTAFSAWQSLRCLRHAVKSTDNTRGWKWKTYSSFLTGQNHWICSKL